MQFHGLELTDYVFYKHAKIRLDVPGITVIYGLNKNAGADPHNSNESGKSMLLRAIPQLIFESSPMVAEPGVKSKAKKDSWESGTAIRILTSSGNARYDLTKRMEGSTFKYDLLRDGNPAKTRRPDYAKEKIAEIFPWSEAEFYTTQYLDSSRPSDLQYGSSARRLEFFSNLFRLDHIDSQRKLVKSQLNDLHDDAVVAEELQARLKELDAELAEIDVDALNTELEETRDLVAKNAKKMKRLYGIQSQLRAVSGILTQYMKVQEHGSTTEELVAVMTKKKKQRKKVRAALEASSAWEAYDKAMRKAVTQISEHKAEWRELEPESWFSGFPKKDVDVSEFKDLYKKNVHRLEKLVNSIEEFDASIKGMSNRIDKLVSSMASDIEALDGIKPKAWLKEHELDRDMLAEHIDELVTKQRDFEAEKRRIDRDMKAYTSTFNGEDCDCSTCKQTVSKSTQIKIVAALVSDLQKLERKIGQCEAALVLAKAVQAVLSNQDVLTDLDTQLAEQKAERKKLAKELDALMEGNAASKRLMEIIDKINQLAPEEPDVERPEDGMTHDQYESLTEEIQALEVVAPHVADCYEVIETYGDDLQETLDELETAIQNTDRKGNKARTALSDLEAQVKLANRSVTEAEELRERVSKLDQTDDAELWEILYDALGNKGLKTLLVQKLAKHLEFNMNKNSNLMFREKIRFEFKVEANNIHILYHRRYGNKNKVADVRTLSGAGSRAFNFLLALAIIPLEPANYRSNLMILDEPCTNMDPPFREKFYNEFLPKLVSIVPSVIVITPQSDLEIPATRVLRVVKDGGVSTIEAIKGSLT